MNKNDRRIRESPLYQGVDEIISYTLSTTPWGGSPSSPTLTVYDFSDNSDVTATVTSGALVVSGDDITTPAFLNLANGTHYRLELTFVIDGNTFETWCDLYGHAPGS